MRKTNPGAFIAIGIGVGVAIGVATNNLAVWLPVGVAIGAAMMTVARRKNDSADSDD